MRGRNKRNVAFAYVLAFEYILAFEYVLANLWETMALTGLRP